MSPPLFFPCRRWHRLIFWNAVALSLLVSLLCPLTRPIWTAVDHYIFRLLNGSLEGHPHWQHFWAMANHRYADWFEDLCILTFYIAAIWNAPPHKRQKRMVQALFCILLIALTVLLINRLLCRDLLKLRRKSPTLIAPVVIDLSDLVPWISFKVNTSRSFPGDHATTALMFGCSYAYFIRGKLGLAGFIYGLLLCLPRLVVGAHWLSDALVGSGSIAIIALSWAFYSPALLTMGMSKWTDPTG